MLAELFEQTRKIMKIIRDCEMIQEGNTNDSIKREELQARAYRAIREVVFGEGAINEYI